MAEFTKTESFLFLVLLLQVSEAGDEFIIRVGDEVTFPCGNVTADQSNCNDTTWLVKQKKSSDGVTPVTNGKLTPWAKGRMRVLENCSLTVNSVTVQDAGRYTCIGPGRSSELDLSVVNLAEEIQGDVVTLKCSVKTLDRLKHTVTWLYKGRPVGTDHPNIHVKSPNSDPSVWFKNRHFAFSSRFELFKCKVKGDTGPEHVFGFRNQSSDPKTTSTTTTTTKTTTPTPATTETASENGTTSKPGASADQRVYIAVVVVLVALLFIVVVVVTCWKIKVNKKKRNENADAEVSYATVSFNNTNSTHVRGGDDAVTYTTVKASSADPSNLYATLE